MNNKVISMEDVLRKRLRELAHIWGPEATKFFTKRQLDMLAGKVEINNECIE